MSTNYANLVKVALTCHFYLRLFVIQIYDIVYIFLGKSRLIENDNLLVTLGRDIHYLAVTNRRLCSNYYICISPTNTKFPGQFILSEREFVDKTFF